MQYLYYIFIYINLISQELSTSTHTENTEGSFALLTQSHAWFQGHFKIGINPSRNYSL